jgi:hypothetical protein
MAKKSKLDKAIDEHLKFLCSQLYPIVSGFIVLGIERDTFIEVVSTVYDWADRMNNHYNSGIADKEAKELDHPTTN